MTYHRTGPRNGPGSRSRAGLLSMPVMRIRHLLFAMFLAPWSGCPDARRNPECPSSFTIGERCPMEGMKCTFPGGRCGSPCYCVNETGGFAWDCPVETCRCTCACGFIAVNSCEALECRKQEDPCPASAAPICALVCGDGGVRDGGRDRGLRDARIDGYRDSARDQIQIRDRHADVRRDIRADSFRDAGTDVPMDARRDAPADARRDAPADAGVDAPADARMDRPMDRGRDALVEGGGG
jgi:hypothetical protein